MKPRTIFEDCRNVKDKSELCALLETISKSIVLPENITNNFSVRISIEVCETARASLKGKSQYPINP